MRKGRLFGGTLTAVAAATLLASAADAQTTPTGKVRSISAGKTVDADTLKPLYVGINPYADNVAAYWGEVNPFWRRMRTFWGDVNPAWRRMRTFWGDIDPQWRRMRTFDSSMPDLDGMEKFWMDNGNLWTEIDALWANAATTPGGYAALGTKLDLLSSQSEAYFGAAVSKQTGKTFDAGFGDAMFAKYGLNLADPDSLAKLPANERSHFFMDWYDGLMGFSGVDHVDHWMKTINWSPKITQEQGSGADTTIGLIDSFVAGDTDIQSKTIYNGGVSKYSTGHGAAVGSLMVAAHDGKGVMGIAPNAKIAAFNPFDATGSADWPDVTKGILAVTAAGASVVNLSLGVPGSTLDTGWRAAFKSVDSVKDTTLYVIAAGNDGVTQTKNVNMKDAFDSTFLVVGSVDPTGVISAFSNRPGEACLLEDRDCKNSLSLKESGLLKHRFIVAPGELILMSDDKGGVARHSGTSFAAPLVSGAIALIHDRWPWLKKEPRDVAQIILRSARDLGAPGTDAVYGVGLLDVEASQSPLDFNALKYYVMTGTDKKEIKAPDLRSRGIQASWETNGIYFTAFEKLENAERDFLIPLSTRLVGQTRNGEYFQDYVQTRLKRWMNGGSKSGGAFAGGGIGGMRLGLSDLGDTHALPNLYGWTVGMTSRLSNETAIRYGADARLATSLDLASPNRGVALTFGTGDGAATMGAAGGFGFASDYDPGLGGVNTVLGFASGGAFAQAAVRVSPGLHLSLGATERTRSRGADRLELVGRGDASALADLTQYKASATNLRLDYQVSRALNVSTSVTMLDEGSGLLGVRAFDSNDLTGADTTAMTLAADLALPHGVSLSVSGTGARTRSDALSALRVSDGGLLGTSYALSLAKQGVLGRGDTLRLSLAQPLNIESGRIELSERQVIDRTTGETGMVTTGFDVSSPTRRYVADVAYAADVLDGAAELSAFGRGEFGGATGTAGYVLGGRARIAF